MAPQQIYHASEPGGQRSANIAPYVWYGLMAFVLLVLSVTFVVATASVSPVYCATCHGQEVASLGETPHAQLRCERCHMAVGLYGLVENRAAMVSMLPAAAGVGTGPDLRVDNGTCLECHAAVLTVPVSGSGIRMSHAEVERANWSCTRCHAFSMHPGDQQMSQGTYSMGDCMECHNATPTNPGTCDVCHVPDKSPEPTASGGRDAERSSPWRVTHGPNWEQTHGMGQLNTCKACHPENYCVRCHGMQVPHPHGFIKDHGRQVMDRANAEADCTTCHLASVCVDCHGGVEMPHPTGFLEDHSQQVKEDGDEVCGRCHDKKSCDGCHTRHTHPGLPQDYLRQLQQRPVR